jgi:hypothetical protein
MALDLPALHAIWVTPPGPGPGQAPPAIIRAAGELSRQDRRAIEKEFGVRLPPTKEAMLPGMIPVTRRTSQAATVTFLAAAVDTANQSTYNFTSQPIGAPGSARHIGIITAANVGSLGATVSSLSVDGAALAAARQQANSFSHCELWFGAVNTTNSTGTVSVSWSASANGCTIFIFECHNILSAVATNSAGSTTDAAAMTAGVDAGGIAIAGGRTNTSGSAFNWTGDLTDHGDEATDGTASASSAAFATAGTASATPDAASASQFCAVMGTFR